MQVLAGQVTILLLSLFAAMLLGEEGLAAPHATVGLLSTLMATLLSLLAGLFPAPASASDAQSVQPQGLLHAALDWSCTLWSCDL